jgi:hypothetical protein
MAICPSESEREGRFSISCNSFKAREYKANDTGLICGLSLWEKSNAAKAACANSNASELSAIADNPFVNNLP